MVYYRLKIAENNGISKYTKVVPVHMAKTSMTIDLYPNPVQTSATLVIKAAKAANIRYVLVDAGGRTVAVQSVTVKEGVNTISLDMNPLSSGTYTLMLQGEETSSQLHFVKQ